MNTGQLKRLKKTLGDISFNTFFKKESKQLTTKPAVKVETTLAEDVVSVTLNLVVVPEGKLTVASKLVKQYTNWTVKKSTDFVKEGEFPKEVLKNLTAEEVQAYSGLIEIVKKEHNIIFEIV